LKQAISKPNTRLKKISSHTPEKIVVVPIGDIIRCNSDNNYTIFYFKDKKMLVSKTLKFYPNLLKELGFLRVHQSHLVVTKFIKEFIKSDGNSLILKDNFNIPVFVRKRNEALEAINSFQSIILRLECLKK
jgi:two-component system LytT family response regulator